MLYRDFLHFLSVRYLNEKQNSTRLLGDMEFLYLCSTRYLTSERIEHSKRNSISPCAHVLLSIYICFCFHCLLTFSSTRSCLSQSSLYHCNAQQSEFRFMYQVTLAKRLGQPNAQYRNRQVVFPPMFMWVLCCMQAINDALNGRRM